ncbi:hypothetical protein [Aurantiacibacter suaedae]|uniref:hypothetical protein n=1 Tax=Aurantiacibacter suaedae TaxID=2545755 RepID=UPI0010F9A7DF|nr:hypothetical protein [Aurantiacibacter suaedae]
MTRKSKAKRTAQAEDGKPLAHPVIAEILIVIIASLLRNMVVQMLERGKFVQTESDRKLLKSSPARRVGLVGVKHLARSSVPGALLVGAGIIANTVIRGRNGE